MPWGQGEYFIAGFRIYPSQLKLPVPIFDSRLEVRQIGRKMLRACINTTGITLYSLSFNYLYDSEPLLQH